MLSFFSPQSLAAKRNIFAGDIVFVFVSFLFAVSTKVGLSSTITFEIWFRQSTWMFVLLLIYPLVFYIFELYDEKRWYNATRLLVYISAAAVTATVLMAMLSYLISPSMFAGRIILALHALNSTLLIFCWRQCYARFFSDQNKEHLGILLLGTSPVLSDIQDIISSRIHNAQRPPVQIEKYTEHTDLPLTITNNQIHTVVVANKLINQPQLRQQLLDLRLSGTKICDAPYYYELLTGKVPVTRIQDSWFLFHNQGESFNPVFYTKAKKIADTTIAALILILLSPLLILIAIAIKMESKGPVFFKQRRVGYMGNQYLVYKFRTMINNAEEKTGPKWASVGDRRITRVGAFLRKTHLDELAQLVNILKGEMSIIGPRPIRKIFEDENIKSIPFYGLRHVLQPGVTGWAQVQSFDPRSENGPLERLQYDLFYLRNKSFIFDLFILLKTAQTVLFGKGV